MKISKLAPNSIILSVLLTATVINAETALTSSIAGPLTIFEVQTAELIDAQIVKTENENGLMYHVMTVFKIKLNFEGNTCNVPLSQVGPNISVRDSSFSGGVVEKNFDIGIFKLDQPNRDPFEVGYPDPCLQYSSPTDIAIPLHFNTFVHSADGKRVIHNYRIETRKIYNEPRFHTLEISFDISNPVVSYRWK
jgi:hypothetical protein